MNQSDLAVTRSPLNSRRMMPIASSCEQPTDDADRLVLAVAQQHRIDPERVGIRRQGPWPRAEDRPSTDHVIKLYHALGDVKRMVIGQGHDPGGQLDARGPFTRRRQEHFGRGDHFPAAGMVLTAPEFVVSELVQVLHELEIAAELQHRVLTDGMMGGEEGAKMQTRHDAVSWLGW